MNVAPRPRAFNKAKRFSYQLRSAEHSRHFPQANVRVSDDHAAACLHGVERVSRNDGMGVGSASRVESVDAVNDEVLVSFQMQVAVLGCQVRR